MHVFTTQLTPAQAEFANNSAVYKSMVSSLPPSPTSPMSPSLEEAFDYLLGTGRAPAAATKNTSSVNCPKPSESDGHRRRLPIFVRLTEREARRRQRILLARALIAELITHRRDIMHFKRLHTSRLEELEHERVAPMEAAAAAVMAAAAAAAAAATTPSTGRRSAANEQQINGKTARAAAAARQRARLSPSELSRNRALSERAVAVLQAADQLEEEGRELLRMAKTIIAIETGKHTEPAIAMVYDSDDESDASMSDTGSDDVSSASGAVSHVGRVVAQLDKLALTVEQLRNTTADFICAYPA
ncbi:hypothetical protein SYNPS1DRAFT_26039 [Syncephalis pseudoplumigaleata]|uniref:Uncharacterized protein n=1 Tax=Syncephalis pseudoplumigaleata TaxID=1712513 RepID=A0A4P9YR12_9FUNG|nr:hypothetical protein SYNPS1DRAFT_26039 [Syncephalis pseudoplumigaleata]|eukprot:RKP22283.1 hypothetical protein SYNPS1DRAFT_26039 [Syncephalis pseudoplumigaleata]